MGSNPKVIIMETQEEVTDAPADTDCDHNCTSPEQTSRPCASELETPCSPTHLFSAPGLRFKIVSDTCSHS